VLNVAFTPRHEADRLVAQVGPRRISQSNHSKALWTLSTASLFFHLHEATCDATEITVQTTTLFKELLSISGTPDYQIAKALGISASTLSRHADGLLRKQSVLDRAAAYFNDILTPKVPITPELLQVPLTAAHLVVTARVALERAERETS
jgi:hypothetical protein